MDGGGEKTCMEAGRFTIPRPFFDVPDLWYRGDRHFGATNLVEMKMSKAWSRQIARDIECDHRDDDGWLIYDIEPMGKPRMTQRDKWKKRSVVERYHNFKDACLYHDVRLFESMEIEFNIKMPTSWSSKKQREMVGQPHQSKPDADNLLKGLFDILDDDSAIWRVHATKRWAKTPCIKIRKIS